MYWFNSTKFLLCVLLICLFPFILLCQKKTIIDSLRSVLSVAKNDTNQFKLLVLFAEEHGNDNTDSALAYAYRALTLAEKINYPRGKFISYNTLGNIYKNVSNYPTAFEFYTKAVQMAEKTADQNSLAVAYTNIGIVYSYLGEYNKAIDYSLKTLPIKQKFKNKTGMANTYNNVAVIYGIKGEYVKAIEYLLKCLEIYEETDNRTGTANCYSNIAKLNSLQRNYNEALNNYLLALKISEDLGDYSSTANIYSGMADVYVYQGMYDTALKSIQKSFMLRKKLNDERGVAESCIDLGDLFLAVFEKYYSEDNRLALSVELSPPPFSRQKMLDSAYHYYATASEMLRKIGSRMYSFHCLSGIGRVLLYQNKPMNALEYYKQALQSALELKTKAEIMQAYKNISDAYRAMGKYRDALDNHALYKQWADSLFDTERNKQINELQIRFETERKEKELALLSKENEVSELKISEQQLSLKQNKILIAVLLIGSLFVLMLVGVLFSRYKIKQRELLKTNLLVQQELRTKAVLEAQEQERHTIAQDLHDGISQQLSALKISFEKIKEYTNHALPEMQILFEKTASMLDETHKEVRTLSHQMMPRALREKDLPCAVSDLLEMSFANSEIQYKFENYSFGALPQNIQICLYRILQELLNNVIRHAGATEVVVQFFKTQNTVVLLVEDNGKGIGVNTEDKKGIGLQNIAARVQTVNGIFHIKPGPVKGTIATIRIPIP